MSGGTPAPVSALSGVYAGSAGYTALPYPPAGQSTMPMPSYDAPAQAVSSYYPGNSGVAVSTSERAPDESVDLLADSKPAANDQPAAAGANDKAKEAASTLKYLSTCGQVRCIIVGVLQFLIAISYFVFDIIGSPTVQVASRKSKTSSDMSYWSLSMILVMLAGVMAISVLRASKIRPPLMFYCNVVLFFVLLCVLVVDMNNLINETSHPKMTDEEYEKRKMMQKLKAAFMAVMLVLSVSQIQIIYMNLQEDAMFLCICINRCIHPTNQTTTNEQQNANAAATSV